MDTHRNPAVASEIPADFQPELLPSPPKTTWEDFFSRQYMEEEEDGEKDSLQWLSIFMEDCLSGTTISALPPASSTSSSFQIPTHSHPSNSPSKSRNTSGRKKMKTNSNFINYSNQSPLLHQKHWLADSELLITPKLDKAVNADGGDSTTSSQPKRCSHCLSQRTPQWRAGPTGPKTLCNACGMRFKTGRLLPEYRPAKSPSFVSYKHSNSHKKVMEMRMAVQSPNFH